jgi:hypothetical protein
MLSLATWAKFTPLILAPMLLTYDPDPSLPAPTPPTPAASTPPDPAPNPRERAVPGEHGVRARIPRAQDAVFSRLKPVLSRSSALFVLGFALVTAAAVTWPLINPGFHTFYERTIAAQAGRSSPFSIWGQVESLEPLRVAILAATGVLAIALAFVPRKKSLLQVAALSAALMLGVQLTLHHWFYLYIVWFFPLLLIALALLEPTEEPGPEEVPGIVRRIRRRREPEPSPELSNPPVPTG